MLVPVVFLLLAAGQGAVLSETALNTNRENSAIQSDGSIRPRDGLDGTDGVRCIYYPSTTVPANGGVANQRLKLKKCKDLRSSSGADWASNKLVSWEWHNNKIRSTVVTGKCWTIAPHDPEFNREKLYFGDDNSRAKIKLVDCGDAITFKQTETSLGWRIGYAGDGEDDVVDGREYCIEATLPQKLSASKDAFLYLSRCGQNGYGTES